MSDEVQKHLDELAVEIKESVDRFLENTGHGVVPNVDVRFKTANQIGKQKFLTMVAVVAEIRSEV